MFQCFMILKSLRLKVVNLWSDFRKKSFATLHRDVAIGVVLVPRNDAVTICFLPKKTQELMTDGASQQCRDQQY